MKNRASWAMMIAFLVVATGINIGYTEYRVRDVESKMRVYITSLDKYQVVHSKVIIDANLPDTIVKVSVRANNTFLANYLPYVWNNIREPAGLYNISVHAWDYNDSEYVDWSLVEIPRFEVYTPANFSAHEDIVIHANQTVIWRDGLFKVGLEDYYDNGLAITNVKPFALNIFGTLILYNMTMKYMRSITLQGHGVLICDTNTTFDWDDLLYREYFLNDYSPIYVEDYSTLYLRSTTKNINKNGLPGTYWADDFSTIYRENDLPNQAMAHDNGTVYNVDSITPYVPDYRFF